MINSIGTIDSNNFQVATLSLEGIFPSITSIDGDNTLSSGQTSVPCLGKNFLDTQGLGKLEFCNSSEYDLATIIEESTIVTWSNELIVFNFASGSLSTGLIYPFVTNNFGQRNFVSILVTYL